MGNRRYCEPQSSFCRPFPRSHDAYTNNLSALRISFSRELILHNCKWSESQKQSSRAIVLQWLLEEHLATAYPGKFILTCPLIFFLCHYLIANYNCCTLNSYHSKYCYPCTISHFCYNSQGDFAKKKKKISFEQKPSEHKAEIILHKVIKTK